MLRFDAARLQTILPHRPPFLLPERVDVLEPGVCGVGFRLIRPDDPYLTVDEHGAPCFPWFLALELLAQTGAVVSASGHPEDLAAAGPQPGFLAAVSLRGLAPIALGRELVGTVRIQKAWGRFIMAASSGRFAAS